MLYFEEHIFRKPIVIPAFGACLLYISPGGSVGDMSDMSYVWRGDRLLFFLVMIIFSDFCGYDFKNQPK